MVCGSCHANVSRSSHELQGYTFGLQPGLIQDSGGFCQIVSVKEKTTDVLYNYYRTKEFVCDNTPLWKLIDAINEAYHADIVIEDSRLKNLPLTTTFHEESLEEILKVISETFNIKMERRGGQIILH